MPHISILVVDDSLENLDILVQYIKELGSRYKIFNGTY